MKVSRNWLQKYVSKEIPKGDAFINLMALNIFEVEDHQVLDGSLNDGGNKNSDEIFDVKVLPDRNPYCLSHRGIAREVAVLIDAEYKVPEFLNNPVAVSADVLQPNIKIVENNICRKYLSRRISNVDVTDSPSWLRESLENLGQRSINSIVDMTNYVMLDSGQPLHAFDADLVFGNITVRLANNGEKITTLDGKEVVLDSVTLVIADDNGPLAIAGVKGGNRAGVTKSTKNIILEAANFNPAAIRKTSVRVNIRNESSKRFENDLPLEFADVGMNDLSLLIAEMYKEAKFSSIFYFGPKNDTPNVVETTTEFIRDCIGTEIPDSEIISILKKCDMSVVSSDNDSGNNKKVKKITVTAPTYRRDISIPQDLAEEVGRIYGYDKIVATEPIRINNLVDGGGSNLHDDIEFSLSTLIRQLLTKIGFDEIIGYTLRGDGDFVLERPLSNDKNKLRTTMVDSTREYIESNSRYLDLLGINQAKVFEIARIFPKSGERTVLSLGVINQKGAKCDKAHVVISNALKYLRENGIIFDGVIESKINEIGTVGTESKIVFDRKVEMCVTADLDLSKMSIDNDHVIFDKNNGDVKGAADLEFSKNHPIKFVKISQYPFATRDIAVLVAGPNGQEGAVYDLIVKQTVAAIGADNFVRATLFDVFTKQFDGVEKTSYAFRIVFQSQTETLKDEVIDNVMKKINEAVVAMGWVVR
jgi:phenylalanyl-tRNA synthetase beta chain